MRGQGLQTRKRYNWIKQPNGRYSIFDVEVFQNFADSERGEVGEIEAKEILRQFYEDRQNGYYPRLHITHQDGSAANAPGAGYIDNLRFANGKFYADYIEVPPNRFREIQDLRYPYRSAEYHPQKKKIMSVALLESQAPFFQFPVLMLADGPERLYSLQAYACNLRSQVICFQEAKMPEEIDDKDKFQEGEDLDMEDAEGDVGEDLPLEDTEEEEDVTDEIRDLNQKIDNLQAMVMQLVASQGGGQYPPAETPSSVAMQQAPINQGSFENKVLEQLTKFNGRMDKLEKMRSEESWDSRLRALCAKYPTINFQEKRAILSKFQDTSAKKVYLDSLAVEAQKFPAHPASKFAADLLEKKDEVVGGYTDPEDAKIAREAHRDYTDTVIHYERTNQQQLQKFQAMYPDVKRYVEVIVTKAKFDNNTRNEMLSRR